MGRQTYKIQFPVIHLLAVTLSHALSVGFVISNDVSDNVRFQTLLPWVMQSSTDHEQALNASCSH